MDDRGAGKGVQYDPSMTSPGMTRNDVDKKGESKLTFPSDMELSSLIEELGDALREPVRIVGLAEPLLGGAEPVVGHHAGATGAHEPPTKSSRNSG